MAYQKTKRVAQKMERVRATILEAALSLVREGGWKLCNVTEVAKRAEIATGTIYTHFRNISALQCAVYRRIGDEEIAVVDAIARTTEAPERKLERSIRTFAERSLRGRVRAYAVIAEQGCPELEGLRRDYHLAFIEQFRGILTEGVAIGTFPIQHPQVTAACVLGAVTEALITPLSEDNSVFLDDQGPLVDAITQFCMRAAGIETAGLGQETMGEKSA